MTTPPPISRELVRRGLALTLDHTDFPALGTKYEGKVRDCYIANGKRVLIATDRISAFDRVLGTLPFKGQVLNGLSAWWFEHTRDIAPSHFLGAPDPAVTIGIECRPLPVELVVRAYVTGVTSTSIWTHYERGERTFCGHTLPDGLRKNDPLPAPILTPSTKAPKGGHDISVSRDQLLAMGVVDARELDRASEYAHALFRRGAEICRAHGLILVDTKYEFGVAPDGSIVVMDEIHTPDSSRFWLASSYADRHAQREEPESFDKEYVRRWLAGNGYTGEGAPPPIPDDIRVEAASRYIDACAMIRGQAFSPNLEDNQARIMRNLKAANVLGMPANLEERGPRSTKEPT